MNKADRYFKSGAYRDVDDTKLDYEGFLNPLVLKRFAEYMQFHRKQSDGVMRDSDNWQLGMDKDVYVKSLLRHTHDVWMEHRGYESREGLEDGLCGVMFNAMGLLLETLKEKDEPRPTNPVRDTSPKGVSNRYRWNINQGNSLGRLIYPRRRTKPRNDR